MNNNLSAETLKLLEKYQRTEETDHLIYFALSASEKDEGNKAILEAIALDEKDHAGIWKRYTKAEVKPSGLKVCLYIALGRILGYTFLIKLMEKGEYTASAAYSRLLEEIPEAQRIITQEQDHENKLSNMLDEERLRYAGAMVLGLNDALVELTGTIAGLTFAFGGTKLVALSGIITGISATLSMAASNYLAQKADGNEDAVKSSLYTGAAYLVTVAFLVAPYLILPDHKYLMAFGFMILAVVLIILCFNYYISVAKSLPFFKRFGEMAGISLGVAFISFVIGLLVKQFLGIDI